MSRQRWSYPYPRWNKDRWITLYFAVCYSILVLCGGFVVLVSSSMSGLAEVVVLSVWGWAMAIVAPLGTVTFMTVQWRQVMAGFAVSDTGVRVRTVLRTRVLAWSEIQDFIAEEADPGPWEWWARMGHWRWQDSAVMGMFIKLRDGELVGTPIRLGTRPTFTTRHGPWTPGGPDEFLYPHEGQALLIAMRQRLAQQTTAVGDVGA